MSADELRRAAEVLRSTSSGFATPWEWEVTSDRKWAVVLNAHGSEVAKCSDDDEAAHIATMHPGVGLALADLLDHAAGRSESKVAHGAVPRAVWSTERDALAVARLINGGAS